MASLPRTVPATSWADRLGGRVGATYPLSDAAEAMRQLVAGTVRGKLAITVL